MNPVKAIIVGAGNRGTVYGSYAIKHPEAFKVVAVAEPRADVRQSFQKEHQIPDANTFEDGFELYHKGIDADFVMICNQDDQHHAHALAALNAGYPVVLEKPIANTLAQCEEIVQTAKEKQLPLLVCHVMRYTNFYIKIKEMLDRGDIGDIVSITHNENVGYWHAAHSYVRGNWRSESTSSPMLLAKSCHDLDMILHLMGSKCTKLSSFGSLRYFTKENAPEGATARCIEGCKAADTCPFDAQRIYLKPEVTGWPVSVITTDVSQEGRLKALKEGPYGRCVYTCDNDVVDRQVVSMEFEHGETVSFSMNALSSSISRVTTIFGTKGEISGRLEDFKFTKKTYLNDQTEEIEVPRGENSELHSGGDFNFMQAVCAYFSGANTHQVITGEEAFLGHKLCFLAEQARHQGTVVDVQ